MQDKSKIGDNRDARNVDLPRDGKTVGAPEKSDKQTNVLNTDVSRETIMPDGTSPRTTVKTRNKPKKADKRQYDDDNTLNKHEEKENRKLANQLHRTESQARKQALDEEQRRRESLKREELRKKHEFERLRHEKEKQDIKNDELRRIKDKAGLESPAEVPEAQPVPECPKPSELYRIFRQNKLSVVESAYNSLYLYCNDKYYSSDVAIRKKYRNIYAHPNSWFQNHVGMWKHNRWSVAVLLLEIIPTLKKGGVRLSKVFEAVGHKLHGLLRHIEYSHVAIRSMGRFFAKAAPIVAIIAACVGFTFFTARSVYFEPALELYIDGQYIGDVSGISNVENAQRSYEESVSINLGRTYRLSCDVEYKPTVILQGQELAQNSMIDAFEKASESYMSSGYGLYVDNVLICASPYKAWIDDTVNDSLETKRKSLSDGGDDVQTVGYYNDMSVVAGTFPSGMMMNLADIRRLFSLEPITDEDFATLQNAVDMELGGRYGKTVETHGNRSRLADESKTVLNSYGDKLPDNGTETVIADVASAENSDVQARETTLDVVVRKNETVTEEIPFETETYENADMLEGKSVVQTKGVSGSKSVTYDVGYIGGKEVEKTVVSETVLTRPTTQVVIIGTRQMTEEEKRTMSHGTYIWPYRGKVSSEYSWRLNGSHNEFHKGMDICGKMNSDIVASDGGEVTFATWDTSGYGYCILIKHDDGTVTRYAHCSELYVEKGQRVGQGEVIAAMGETGNASGVHVHFEVIVGGKAQNPRNYLEE